MPLSRLHVPDIGAEVVARGIVAEVSGTTIWRWLSDDAIRPWRQRSWILPRDPDFEAKAGRLLDLYAGTWVGKTLGKRDYVIYEHSAAPFEWRFNRSDFAKLLERLADKPDHRQAA